MGNQKNQERKPFNFGDAPLIKDTEQTVQDGYDRIENKEHQSPSVASGLHPDTTTAPASASQEPTKGVQTYVSMSVYRRLNDIKLTRGKGTTIANLVAEAIVFWLDHQEE